MKRTAALLLCALLLAALLAGCQPSEEALLRRGVESRAFDLDELQELVEAALLAGEPEINVNYRGSYRTVERAVQDGMRLICQRLSYAANRFTAGYRVECVEERGYVPTRILLEPKDAELLADMPRLLAGGLSTEAYGPASLEALLMHMMESKIPRAVRRYSGYTLDALNGTLRQDLQAVMDNNYAYGYLVESAEWTLSEYQQEGGPFLELDLTLSYLPDTLPLSDIPVVSTRMALIEALIDGWAAGDKKTTLIMEGLRPDEETLFAWINTAEVNSAGLACEGDSIWYEVLENPGERQIGRFWLEFGAGEELIAPAQARLNGAIAAEAEALGPKVKDMAPRDAYRAVFDRVLAMTSYDDEIREATDRESLTEEMQLLRSAYGALVAGRTVCTGYARAFQALCDALGLPCWTVNGYQDGEGHAWNMVRLDGQTLCVDCTFADTGGDPDRYFLFDQAQLEKRRYEMDEGFIMPW